MTNSSVIIADAIHSFTDFTNNIIAWIAVKISTAPADKSHPYGHQKFEQLAVFILASLLVIVAFEILVSAYKRFGQPVEQSLVGLVILIGALVINSILAFWEGYWAKRLDSDILQADASHTLSDVLTSIAVIIGWQLASKGYFWVDSAFAIIMACIIFYLAFKLFLRAVPILVDSSDIDSVKISQAINQIEEVKRVLRVRSRSSGKNKLADVVVAVDAEMTTNDSHNVADNIEHILAEKFAIEDAVIHIEPFESDKK